MRPALQLSRREPRCGEGPGPDGSKRPSDWMSWLSQPRCEESNVGQTMGMWNRNGTEEKSFSTFGIARLYDCIESRRGMLRPSSRSGSREGVAIPRRAFT